MVAFSISNSEIDDNPLDFIHIENSSTEFFSTAISLSVTNA